MASEIKIDRLGGQYRVVGGQEEVAMWLPLTVAEKEAAIDKAIETNTPLTAVLADAVRTWLQGNELSLDQLEKVAGGVATKLQYDNIQNLRGAMKSNPSGFEDLASGMTTVMCAW